MKLFAVASRLECNTDTYFRRVRRDPPGDFCACPEIMVRFNAPDHCGYIEQDGSGISSTNET